MAKEIDVIGSDRKFVVDDCDFDFLNQWQWTLFGGHAIRRTENGDIIFLHEEVWRRMQEEKERDNGTEVEDDEQLN